MIRTIVKSVVTFDMGKPTLRNIFKKQEATPSASDVNSAVASLDKDELTTLNLSLMLGNFGDHSMGYEKIAQFVQDGQPSEELKASIKRTFAEKFD